MSKFVLHQIEFEHLPGVSRLFRELCAGEELRLAFLGFGRWDPETLLARSAREREKPRTLADLVRQNPAGEPAVAESLELAKRGGAVFVITGQQAGLFTGPLYTIYKAITVLRLVAALRGAGVPAVGLFWIAGEDHDLAEVSTVHPLPAGVEGRSLALALQPPAPHPVSGIELPGDIAGIVTGFLETMPSTDFRAGLASWLHVSYRPGETIGRAFRRLMQQLFAPRGLLFLDPLEMDRGPLLAEFLERFPELRPELIRRVEAATARLAAAGYPPQVDFHPARSFLFYLDPDLGRRRVVELPRGGFMAEGTSHRWSPGEWPGRLADEAARFSPDALLRPLFQDWLFPTVAYVAGPAEIAYHLQIRGLYPLWGLEAPLLWPRGAATLMSPGAARRAAQLGLAAGDLFSERSVLLEGILARSGRLSALDQFHGRRVEVEGALERLAGVLSSGPDDLVRSGEGSFGKIRGLLEKMEDRVYRQIKQDNSDITQRLDALLQEIQPNGNLQERTLNLFPFLSLYGPELLTALVEALDPFRQAHHLLWPEV